jgi:FKBP-type peptidyl-prolyl cis-trans isomerase
MVVLRNLLPLLTGFAFVWLAGCGSDADRRGEAPVPQAPAEASVSEPGPSDADAPKEFAATDSGLKYRVLRKSDKSTPKASDTVTVNYRGWLDDGTEFDSSYRRGEPATFPLGGVIPGWTEGLQLVGEGGKIELEIPSELGYGAGGMPPKIPGGATLHFIVELIRIN